MVGNVVWGALEVAGKSFADGVAGGAKWLGSNKDWIQTVAVGLASTAALFKLYFDGRTLKNATSSTELQRNSNRQQRFTWAVEKLGSSGWKEPGQGLASARTIRRIAQEDSFYLDDATNILAFVTVQARGLAGRSEGAGRPARCEWTACLR